MTHQGYDGYYDSSQSDAMSGIGDAVDDAANAVAAQVAAQAAAPAANSNPVAVPEEDNTLRNVGIGGAGLLVAYLLYRHFR